MLMWCRSAVSFSSFLSPADIDRKIGSMIKAIEDGMYHASMKERMAQLEADRAALISEAAATEVSKVDVLVHPNLPELYRRKGK
jgi:site-specific DNA recombinase